MGFPHSSHLLVELAPQRYQQPSGGLASSSVWGCTGCHHPSLFGQLTVEKGQITAVLTDRKKRMDDGRLEQAKNAILALVERNPALHAPIARHIANFCASIYSMDSCSPQTAHERIRIDHRIRNFDYERSEAWEELRRRGWDQLSQTELLSLALVLSRKLNIGIDREAKRRKSILVKWFDENLVELRAKMDCISLLYKDGGSQPPVRGADMQGK